MMPLKSHFSIVGQPCSRFKYMYIPLSMNEDIYTANMDSEGF